MAERRTESGISRKFLLGIALMLSVVIAFVTFAKKATPILQKLGLSFYEILLTIVGEYVISIAMIYLIVMWMEKSTEKGALTKKDVLLYTAVQTLIVIKILILTVAG